MTIRRRDISRRSFLQSGAGGLAAAMLAAFPSVQALTQGSIMKRILFFTKSSGYEHSVVQRQGGGLAHAERILMELGTANGFEVVATKDGRLFNRDTLAQFDAFAFYTTGDLTKEGTDKQPPMTLEGKQALLEAVEQGKGFIGFHCATDTFHSPAEGSSLLRPDEQREGQQIDPYIAMVGGEFLSHGRQQTARQRIVSPGFPGLEGLKEFELHEEWYAFRNLARDLHVILIQETEGMEGEMYEQPPYPATWARMHGRGRVWYTGLGHREDVWTNEIFQRIVLGGIAWTLGRAEADVRPNLPQVLPHLELD
jgi:uncharacterized protein